MIDLEDRLRAHLDDRADRATPIDALDVILAGEGLASTSGTGHSRRPWLLVAAAGLVAVLVGGLLVVQRGDGSSPAAPPPLPAGIPPTGAEWTRTGHLTVETAIAVLIHECMARAGFDYDPQVEEFGVAMGAWEPHPVLGVTTEAAAKRYGYRMAYPSLGITAAADALDGDEQDRFYEALMPPAGGGCRAEAEAELGGTLSEQDALRGQVLEGPNDQTARAQADPRVADALTRWSQCVFEATAESADTPNGLARRSSMSGFELTDREIEIATADVRCQSETGLQETWYRVLAEYQRAALDRPETFDQLAAMRVEIVANAQRVLDERGIVVVSAGTDR